MEAPFWRFLEAPGKPWRPRALEAEGPGGPEVSEGLWRLEPPKSAWKVVEVSENAWKRLETPWPLEAPRPLEAPEGPWRPLEASWRLLGGQW